MFNKRNNFIDLKDKLWLKRQKVAGKAVSACLKSFAGICNNPFLVDEGVTLKYIEEVCLEILDEHGCTPTFLDYDGFPGAVCISANENIVHGVPTDYRLKSGDIITLDLGATYEGAIADAAFSCVFGKTDNEEHIRLLKTCQDALNKGIEAFQVGKRIGGIGSAISRHVRGSDFGLVTDYGGHGISYDKPHAEPFVANVGHGNEGPRIQNWMAIAIEPMLVLDGHTKLKTLDDKWTLAAKAIGCHFEHSVTTDGNGDVHIITDHGMDVQDFV